MMIRSIVAIISMLVTATTQAQTAETPTGELGFAHGVSTKETVKQITNEMEFLRACRLCLGIADTRPMTVAQVD